VSVHRGRKHERRIIWIDAGKLRHCRRQRGWTQENLAEAAQLSARTISQIERGQPVFVSTLACLAKALEVLPSELVQGKAPQVNASENTHAQGRAGERNETEGVRLVVTLPPEGGKTRVSHLVAILKGLGCRVGRLRKRGTK